MGRVILFYAALIVFMDAILLGLVAHPVFFALFLMSGFLFWLWKKTKTNKAIEVVSGLDLGEGTDIMNPDSPKKVRVILEEKALDLGFLAIGGPGSGKSICSIIIMAYYTLVRKIGWVYWDGKGDLDVYQKGVASGAKPDYFFSSDLEHSDTTNVVAGPTEEVIEALTQTLITSENEYYRTAQREALGAVVPVLKEIGKPIILRDIYVALKIEEVGDYVMNLAKEQGVKPETIEVARQFFAKDPMQRANDVNGLVTKMSLYVTGNIADRLNAYEPTLDLEKCSKTGKRVFMHLPLSSRAKDIATFFTEQIGVIAKNRQLYDKKRTPWPMIYDDWGKFFYANIGPITARSRSGKMPCSFLFQSRGQTDAVDMSRIFTTEITDNIGGFISFRINGQDTAKWVSEQFGTYETTEISANSSADSQTASTQEKPRVRADSLKNMNAGEVCIDYLVAGEKGASENRKVRARFPFPDMKENPDDIDWPVIEITKNNDECEGLHLWRDFMNPDRLQELKKAVVKEALEEAASKNTEDAEQADEDEHLFL